MIPQSARDKLSHLEQIAADAKALQHSALHAESLIQGRIGDAVQRLNTMPAESEQYQALQEQIESLREDLEKKKTERLARAKNASKAAQLVSNVDLYLRRHDGDYEAVPVPKVTASLEAIRHAITDTQARIREVSGAHLDADTLKEQARAYVDRLAEQAAPIVHCKDRFMVKAPTPPLHATNYEKALALQCWLNPDAVFDALTRDIPDSGMSAAAKAKKLEALEAELLNLERQEEAIVPDHDRRIDANPLAVLGIRPAVKKKNAA